MRPYLILATAAILASCAKDPTPSKAVATRAPLAVETVAVATVSWPGVYEATGTVRSRATTSVSAQRMGYARQVRAAIGDTVREGQTLVVLDTRALDTSVRRAESTREENAAALKEAESGIAAARAQLELAQVTYSRLQGLFEQRSVTRQELDEASTRRKASESALAMATAKRSQIEARSNQLEQEVEATRIERGYMEVKAPFSGIITSKSIEPGALALPGAPLFMVERAGAYRLEAAVEESRLSLVGVGQMIPVRLDGLVSEGTPRTVNARIEEIVPDIDPLTRTGTVKLNLPALPEIRSGLFGRALFPTAPRSALVLPVGAVLEQGQLQTVFVAEQKTARSRLVTTGLRDGNRVEILSGLTPGELVIVPVPAGLTDGAPIEVRR